MIMKRFNKIVCAALAVAAVAACDNEPEVVDFPIVGDFTITAAYPGGMNEDYSDNEYYAHGTQGWTAMDKLGVFVTSDGVLQANLAYVPSEVCPLVDNEYMEGMKTYDDENVVVEAVALNAEGAKAGFKKGEHKIYAYMPYVEGVTDYTAVPMPDLSVQSGVNPVNGLFSPDPAYLFAYAKAEAGNEHSTTPVALGNMIPVHTQMTLVSPTFPDELVGKAVTAITISADVDIVAKNATFNLETEKIEGEWSKTITVNVPEGGYVIEESYFGAAYSTTTYVVINLDGATALTTDFTFAFVVDGVEYKATAKPGDAESWGMKLSSENNLNTSGLLDFSGSEE